MRRPVCPRRSIASRVGGGGTRPIHTASIVGPTTANYIQAITTLDHERHADGESTEDASEKQYSKVYSETVDEDNSGQQRAEEERTTDNNDDTRDNRDRRQQRERELHKLG